MEKVRDGKANIRMELTQFEMNPNKGKVSKAKTDADKAKS